MKDKDLVNKARSFSSSLFSSTMRLSGDSAYAHAERVFSILQNNSISDELTLAASLLHPLCDEASFDENLIKQEFGEEITNILKNYAKLKRSKIDKETPRAYNEAFFMQAFLKLSQDVRTLVIRLADKLDNLETAYALNKEKRENAANKVLYLYAIVAKAVGLGKMYRQMEDEAFKSLHPREYKLIEKALNIKEHDAKKLLSDAKTYLEELLSEHKINAQISFRFKHVYGIFKKLLHHKVISEITERDLNNVTDIVAMRIIVDTVEQCYAVENILNDTWDFYPEMRDDYISKPRPSGYKSLHGNYILSKNLNVEIQIRTQEMHEYNEYGPASHLLYKIGDKGAQSLAHKKLLEYTKENKFWFKDLNLTYFESLGSDVLQKIPFSKKIYCFTPKGDILELVKDASILDFAYALHSDLGDKCIGAFVNGQFVGLDHVLKDGDTVIIKALKKNNVNRDWLKIAKSQKTKAHIRKALGKG